MHILRTVTIAAVLIVAAFATSGCAVTDASGPDSLRHWFSEMDEGEGEPAELAARADALLQSSRGSSQDDRTQGRAALLYDRAATNLAKLVDDGDHEENPAELASYIRRAADAWAASSLPDAAGESARRYERVLELTPGDPLAHAGLGLVYFDAGLHERAVPHLQVALEQPDKLSQRHIARAHTALGVAADSSCPGTRPQEALGHYTAALRAEPHNVAALVNLGAHHLLRHENHEAAHVLRRAVRTGNAPPRALNNLGLALARLGQHGPALEAFSMAGPEHTALNNLGYILYVTGDYARAEYFLKRAVAASPGYYEVAGANLRRVRLAKSFGGGAQVEAAASQTPEVTSAPITQVSYEPQDATTPRPAMARTQPSAAVPANSAVPVAPVGPVGPVGPVATISQPAPSAPQTTPAPAPQAAPSAQSPDAPFGLHISSWQQLERAQEHATTLMRHGTPARILTREVGGTTWYRVVAGAFADLDTASKALARRQDDPAQAKAYESARVVRFAKAGSPLS